MDPGGEEGDGNFIALQHRSKKYRPSQLSKLNPVEKSKYMFYEKPNKDAVLAKESALKRVRMEIKERNVKMEDYRRIQIEKQQLEKHNQLIGQLKAAEARNRIRLLRIRYNNIRFSELEQMVAYQPTSLRAVRLQALVPQNNQVVLEKDEMHKNERQRIEEIIDDETMLSTHRDLTCI